MADVFTVGALALAAEGANAVGAVRITLHADELEIELIRAGRFERGFVPAIVAQSAPMRVPYAAVRGLVRRGRALCLALDPQLGTPHTRFTLAHFSHEPLEALAHVYEGRRRATWFVAIMPMIVGSVFAYASPPTLASGLVGRLSAGTVAALVTWFILRDLLQVATWGGAASDRLSEAFEQALCVRLGLAPLPQGKPTKFAVPAPELEPPPAPKSFELPSWARAGLAVLVASVAVVLGVAFFRKYSKPPDESERVVLKEPAARISSVWSAKSPAEILPSKPRLPRCVCARPSSPLWNDGIAALEVLFATKPDDGSGVVAPVLDRKNRPKYDFDVSVVNNAATPLPDVTLHLTFARRNQAGERVGATDRGLYFAGPLLPGRAVKWHVTAPGSEMRVEPSVVGPLAPERPVAPADAFFELASARQRAVRIHAAKMLAYHRDSRALEVLAALGAPFPGEERLLGRINRATRPIFACEINAAQDALEVCLVNTTLAPVQVAALSPLTLEDAPVKRYAVEVEVPVHDGVRVRLPGVMNPVPAEIDIELVK